MGYQGLTMTDIDHEQIDNILTGDIEDALLHIKSLSGSIVCEYQSNLQSLRSKCHPVMTVNRFCLLEDELYRASKREIPDDILEAKKVLDNQGKIKSVDELKQCLTAIDTIERGNYWFGMWGLMPRDDERSPEHYDHHESELNLFFSRVFPENPIRQISPYKDIQVGLHTVTGIFVWSLSEHTCGDDNVRRLLHLITSRPI